MQKLVKLPDGTVVNPKEVNPATVSYIHYHEIKKLFRKKYQVVMSVKQPHGNWLWVFDEEIKAKTLVEKLFDAINAIEPHDPMADQPKSIR